MSVYITTGTGSVQLRTISTYVGGTKIATLTSNWTTNPSASDSVYSVAPKVTVSSGVNGSNATALFLVLLSFFYYQHELHLYY
jgi:hypothetical protein